MLTAGLLARHSRTLEPVRLQELEQVAAATAGFSARDLRAICEVAERRWLSALVRGEREKGSLPPVAAYLDSARAREAALRGTREGG